MKILSSIVTGHIAHVRHLPKAHAFRYPVRMQCLELGELEKADLCSSTLGNLLLGYNRRRVYSICDSDYLGLGEGSIREKLYGELRARGITTQFEKVFLLTSPRFFGYVFNPVSFYFCLKKDNSLSAFVAEVNNTFGDKHIYVKGFSEVEGRAGEHEFSLPKEFHVSPFNPVQGDYHFLVRFDEKKIFVNIDIERERKIEFSGLIDGECLPWSASSLLWETICHPVRVWMSMPLILFEAARLYYGKGMKHYRRPNPHSKDTLRVRNPNFFERWCFRRFCKAMKRLEKGTLIVKTPEGMDYIFPGDKDRDVHAHIQVEDYAFFPNVLFKRDVGLGDAYTKGYFHTDSLSGLIALLAVNMKAIGKLSSLESLALFPSKILHFVRRNTLTGSRRNIAAHYDLPDKLFHIFLDETRTYSSALFASSGEDLKNAQLRKIDCLLDGLQLDEKKIVLEIGCGWGALALRAVQRFGCRMHCITLSENQHAYVTEKVQAAGLGEKITVQLLDYRKLDPKAAQYDAIVSVEMVEAVGRENLPAYFEQCAKLLKPGGRFAFQAITMPEDRIKEYQSTCDWIQLRIFPGCYVPSLRCLNEAWGKSGGLVLESSRNIGVHYAETLRRWKLEFLKQRLEVSKLGLGEEFLRAWEYYFAYCEAGFDTRMISTYQMWFQKLGKDLEDLERSRQSLNGREEWLDIERSDGRGAA